MTYDDLKGHFKILWLWPSGKWCLLVTLVINIISRLQKVQNAAARMAVHAGWWAHISPILKHLLWLLIRQHIIYKALVLMFRGWHGLAPKYISVLLWQYIPGCHLRSAGSMDFHVPRLNGGYGDRRFGVAAPRLWSFLPLEFKAASSLISFNWKLKPDLFLQAYGPNKWLIWGVGCNILDHFGAVDVLVVLLILA